MKDEEKTKEQLTNELKKMRQRVAELEASEIELKQAEEKLKYQKKHLESLIKYSSLAIVTLDEKHNIISCNRDFEKLFQFEESKILGKNLDEVIAGHEYIEDAISYTKETLSGKVIHGSGKRQRKDGIYIDVEFFGIPVVIEKKVVGAYGIYQDISSRKRAEEALKESEERLSQIVQGNSVPAFVIDSNHIITYWNMACENLTGFSANEVIGTQKQWSAFYPLERPVMADLIVDNLPEKEITRYYGSKYQKSLLIEGAYEAEDFFPHLGEKGKWLFFTAAPLKDSEGKVIGAIETLQDITERKQAEQALRESEEKYRTILESIEEGYYEVDLAGNFTFFNDSLFKIVGYPKDELMGMNYKEYTDKESAKRLLETFNKVYTTGKPGTLRDYEVIAKDGTISIHETSVSLIKDNKSQAIGFRGISRDVTERKQAEEALRMSEEKYRTMLDSIEEGYFEVDIAGNFTFVNDSECRILGYPRDELIGMNNRQYMDEKDAKKVYQGFNRIFKTGIPSKILDWELIRKDGTKLFVEIAASLIKDSEGHPTGFRGILRDVTERKQAEKALRESEERFRILVEESPLGVSLIGKDGRYKYMNPKFVEIFGYTLEDTPTGQVWFRKAYPDEEYRHQVISTWKTDLEKLKQGESRPQIFNVTCKDGSEKIIHFRPVTMETGDQFLIHEDITERKQAEDTLQKSEEKYRTILESIEDGYFEVDIAGNFTFFNDSLCKMLGYSRDEMMGMNNREYMDQENAKKVYKKYNRIYKTGKPDKGFESGYIRKDGTRRHAETSVSLIKDTEDNPIGFRGIYRDVTEKKQAEAELIQTKNFLQNIFDSSTDGITTTDLHGNVMFASPRVKNILGHEQNEIIGKKIHFLYSNGIEDARTIMNELTTKGELRDHEMKLIRKDGELIDINLSASLLMDEKGEVIGTLGIYRDITEKKKLEAQLQYSQRMEAIGTLAGGIAHNFNNLLMGMQGNVSMMLLDTDSDHPNYERLTNIEKMVQSGSKLTSQLLGYARGGRYEVRPISFNQLVKETSDTFDITKKDITVHQDIDKDLFGIIADQGQIEQVLLNLYVNAADAMPQGGDLFLKTVNVTHEDMKGKPYTPKPGNYALLTVRDTGVGMDKKTLDCIFDPFFTTKGLAKGTGLGLASVYGIIKAHGGYIDVYSEKGHGCYLLYISSSHKRRAQRAKGREHGTRGNCPWKRDNSSCR